MEISEGIANAIGTLAKKLDVDETEMRTSIEKLMTDKKLPDATALAEWKRRNRGLFRSKNYDFIVFGKTNPRTAKVKDRDHPGELVEKEVSNLDIIVKSESGLKAYVISFWGENADSTEGFEVGSVYRARLALGAGGYANIIQKADKAEVKKVKSSDIPPLEQLLKKIKADDIAVASEKGKAYGFYTGFVTRINEKGVELDSIASLPVMCWISDVAGDVPDLEQGSTALLFGRPYTNQKGETNISVHAIFAVTSEE